MKKILFVLCILIYCFTVFSQEMIRIWPEGKMPDSKGMELKDSISENRLHQVGFPRLYVFPAPKEINTGVAVLIVPGGGYVRLPSSYESNPFASYLNSIGINAFVLCHRLPTSPDLITRQIAPLQDAQRSMKIIRSRAKEWGIDLEKVGVSGASAGGHVASTLATHLEDVSKIGDQIDQIDYKPDFMVLISPVISFDDAIAHKGSKQALLGSNPSEELIKAYSNETRVTEHTPPTFLVHANDDKSVSSLNSIAFYRALKEAGVSSSLHIFPYGGHSISATNNPGSTEMWTSICTAWLKEMKIIPE